MRTLTAALALALIAACSKTSSTPTTTTTPEPTTEPTTEPTPEPEPSDAPPAADRPQLSAPDCEAQGGKVVGDIGDGAIHKPEYVCPDSGKPPIGSIVAEPGGPTAVEGSVCCK